MAQFSLDRRVQHPMDGFGFIDASLGRVREMRPLREPILSSGLLAKSSGMTAHLLADGRSNHADRGIRPSVVRMLNSELLK
jgi:hypothetical protein